MSRAQVRRAGCAQFTHDRGVDEDDELDGPRTPAAWYTIPVMSAECRRNAARMGHVARLSDKRLDLLDPRRAKRCRELERELLEVADRIQQWQWLMADDLVIERGEVMPKMVELLREVLGILEAMPAHAVLGPVSKG